MKIKFEITSTSLAQTSVLSCTGAFFSQFINRFITHQTYLQVLLGSRDINLIYFFKCLYITLLERALCHSVQDYSVFMCISKPDTMLHRLLNVFFAFSCSSLLSLGDMLNTQFRIAKKWVFFMKATLVSPVHFCLRIASVQLH